MIKKLFLIFILFISASSMAGKFTSYFASIKSSEVNVRKGPHTRYPISWVFKKKGEPVEVIAEFEHWKRIKDVAGEEGWVKANMITKKRSAVVLGFKQNKDQKADKFFVNIFRIPETSGKIFAKVESGKRISLKQCKKEWCLISIENVEGWIEKKFLWGVYANEEFK